MKATPFFKIISICCALAILSLLVETNARASDWTPPKIEKPKSYPKYPERPIEFIMNWGVGGGTDINGRKLCDLVRKYYGINIIVTNMPGAGGVRGNDFAMRQPADGYTITYLGWNNYLNYLVKKTKISPYDTYMLIISQFCPGAYWVHGDDTRFKTWQDVIEYSKAHPYELKVADVGRGGSGDYMLAKWERLAGLKLTYVPYDKPNERYASLAGRHVDILFEQPGDIPHLIEQGARPLVFMQKGPKLEAFKEIPTATELGYDITQQIWRGIGCRADVPAEIREYLSKIFLAAALSPEYKEWQKKSYSSDFVVAGDEAQKMYVEEYIAVAKEMGIEPDAASKKK